MKIILILEAEGGSVPADTRRGDASRYRVCTGTEPAGRETAEALFTLTVPPIETSLLDEVPGPGTGFRAWLDRRRGAGRRAGELLDMLEKDELDSVVICGRQMMYALRGGLRARGYLLEGGGLLPRPLERVRATKRSLHCGGCAHNCLLSEAKCEKGRNKLKGIR